MSKKVMVATKPCPMCGKQKTLLVDKESFEKWSKGQMLIQDAFPEMNADDRERLISGFCPKCWNESFGNEED